MSSPKINIVAAPVRGTNNGHNILFRKADCLTYYDKSFRHSASNDFHLEYFFKTVYPTILLLLYFTIQREIEADFFKICKESRLYANCQQNATRLNDEGGPLTGTIKSKCHNSSPWSSCS